MVEDEQIKTEVSPFAIREGEIKTFDGKDGYVSMNQIIHKIIQSYCVKTLLHNFVHDKISSHLVKFLLIILISTT